jgi:hypothetical protein
MDVSATFNSYADMANIPRCFSVQNLLVVFFGGPLSMHDISSVVSLATIYA